MGQLHPKPRARGTGGAGGAQIGLYPRKCFGGYLSARYQHHAVSRGTCIGRLGLLQSRLNKRSKVLKEIEEP